MARERSPRTPAESLPDSIVRTEALYAAAGRSPVVSEIAAKAIGYSSLSGASKTALAAMSYYGLIQREGDKHRISELGLRLIRPLSADDKLEAAGMAAMKPQIFADIEENHRECNESVLASVLLRMGFTDEGARRAAKVYKENVAFIESLTQNDGHGASPSEDRPEPVSMDLSRTVLPTQIPGEKMLAQYQIPLGANQAQLTFTGEKLMPEDFDALEEYVRLFKQQFERKRNAEMRARADFPDDGPMS